MTDRIYYTEPSCRSFEATVTRVDEREGRSVVVLDRTAFYPEAGGQLGDRGLIYAPAGGVSSLPPVRKSVH